MYAANGKAFASKRHSAIGGAALVLMCVAPLSAQQPPRGRAPYPPLLFDSLTVRAILSDAIAAARAAPANEQPALLAAVGRVQVDVRDFTAAEQTLGLVGHIPPQQVLRQLGQPEWHAMLDRAPLARRLACGLYEGGRPDEAVAMVRRMPPGAEREWELAHLASLSARAGPDPRDTAAVRRDDSEGRRRKALEIAREVALPEARLDALLAIAGSAVDTPPGRAAVVAAYDAARRVRLVDQDRQRSRDAMLAALAVRLGRERDARSLSGGLSHPKDLAYVVANASGQSGAERFLHDLVSRAVVAGRALRDSAARDAYLGSLRESLRRGGDSALADRTLPVRSASPLRTPREARDSALAASLHPADLAKRALDRGDFTEVRRQAERLPLGDRRAARAELWADLAWAIYGADRDTAKAYLRLAREALLRARPDSETFDDRASAITSIQFWIGDHDEGIATLNLVRDPVLGAYRVSQWGESTAAGLTAPRLRTYADRVRDPRVRDAVLLRVVSGYLLGPRASAADVAWARALSDSIVTPHHRAQARRAIAGSSAQRGDTLRARQEYVSLLRDSVLTAALEEENGSVAVIGHLVVIGGWREAEAWARATAAPAVRARRLIAVATSLHRELEARRLGGSWLRLWHGPHPCLDVF